MPTYEYKCEACGHAFENFQSMSSAPIKKCPKCGKLKVKRLIGTGAGLIFKGSGFYITDYRDKSYGEKAKADTAGPASSDASAGGEKSKPAEPSKPAGGETAKPASAPAPAPAPAPAAPKPEPKASKSAKKK